MQGFDHYLEKCTFSQMCLENIWYITCLPRNLLCTVQHLCQSLSLELSTLNGSKYLCYVTVHEALVLGKVNLLNQLRDGRKHTPELSVYVATLVSLDEGWVSCTMIKQAHREIRKKTALVPLLFLRNSIL